MINHNFIIEDPRFCYGRPLTFRVYGHLDLVIPKTLHAVHEEISLENIASGGKRCSLSSFYAAMELGEKRGAIKRVEPGRDGFIRVRNDFYDNSGGNGLLGDLLERMKISFGARPAIA